MKPIKINDKWYIEMYTNEFGNILLLDGIDKLNPKEFCIKEEALNYIKLNKK